MKTVQLDGQTVRIREPKRTKGHQSLQDRQKKLWKKFRNDPKLWIENCLWVVNDEGEEVPFVFNNVQEIYYQILVDLYWKPFKTLASGEVIYRFQGVREINMKARQFGLSTLICALLLHDTLFFKNAKTYIFCQDDDKSKEMLAEKIKFFWEHIQPDPLIVLPKTETYNETLVKFEGIKSQIKAQTPGSSTGVARKKGRSVTLKNALLSEFAEFEDAETLWQGLAPAVRNKKTNVFIESSPYPLKSGPFFRQMYEEGKRPDSMWNSRFWPWFIFDKYATPFESEEHKAEFRESITDEELVLRELYNLTEEQLLWRRETISFLGGGKRGELKFQHDFPSNETEGFETSDEDLFFKDSDENLQQMLSQFEEPVEDEMYVITVDVAKGKLKQPGVSKKKSTKKNDFASIKVARYSQRKCVASWTSRTFSIRRLHWKVYEYFCKYPGPVAIENNGIGETTVALARLIKDEFFQKMLYWSSRGDDGFRTGDNKQQMLYDLREQLEIGVRAYAGLEPDEKEPDLPQGYRYCDEEFANEMNHFLDLGDGTFGARSGQHDDNVMSHAIMVQMLRIAPSYLKRFKKYYPKREMFRVPIGKLEDDEKTDQNDLAL